MRAAPLVGLDQLLPPFNLFVWIPQKKPSRPRIYWYKLLSGPLQNMGYPFPISNATSHPLRKSKLASIQCSAMANKCNHLPNIALFTTFKMMGLGRALIYLKVHRTKKAVGSTEYSYKQQLNSSE